MTPADADRLRRAVRDADKGAVTLETLQWLRKLLADRQRQDAEGRGEAKQLDARLQEALGTADPKQAEAALAALRRRQAAEAKRAAAALREYEQEFADKAEEDD